MKTGAIIASAAIAALVFGLLLGLAGIFVGKSGCEEGHTDALSKRLEALIEENKQLRAEARHAEAQVEELNFKIGEQHADFQDALTELSNQAPTISDPACWAFADSINRAIGLLDKQTCHTPGSEGDCSRIHESTDPRVSVFEVVGYAGACKAEYDKQRVRVNRRWELVKGQVE